MSLAKWADKTAASPEEKAAKKSADKEATKTAKKESAAKVKETAKSAEAASKKANSTNYPSDHKAAAEAHQTAENAARKHYYNFRNSRATNERLHDDMQAHARQREAHTINEKSASAFAQEAGRVAFRASDATLANKGTAENHTAASQAHHLAALAHEQAVKREMESKPTWSTPPTPGMHTSWMAYHGQRAEMHHANASAHAEKAIAHGASDDKFVRDEHGRFAPK